VKQPPPTHKKLIGRRGQNHPSLLGALLCGLALLPGCNIFPLHAPGLTIIASNHGQEPVRNIEVDFPGGSYGIGTILPGASATRWIKPTSSAPLRILYSDASGDHQLNAMLLKPGDSGSIRINFQPHGDASVVDGRKQ
jgi:hypothetical protein